MSRKFFGNTEFKGKVKLTPEIANRVPVIDNNAELSSSAVTSTELGYLSGTTSSVQDQLDAKADDTALQDHINDTAGAHAASAISNTPSGNLAATDVQSALNELQSDVDTRALDSVVIKKDGSVAFTGNQSMGGNRITNMSVPSASGDAATKGYVDSVAEGLKPKTAVRAASTANIDLTTGGQITVDGVALNSGDRVLVKDQSTASQNGIYVVAVGAWTRSTDFDSVSPIDEINGAYTFVQEGTQAGRGYVQTGSVTVVGTSPIVFTYFNSVASLVGGDGITITGNDISVDHDGQGLQFVASQLALELDGSSLTKSVDGLKLSNTGVSPNSYGSSSQVATFTVDIQGRLTAANSTAISITASQVSDFSEAAQDAVGTALADSSSVDFTYNDTAGTISAAVLPGGVDHDQLLNYVANDHVDHSTVEIQTAANSGLAGGGDITASRSLVVDITGTTAETTPSDADEILIYDVSASARRKMTRGNFLSGISNLYPGDIAPTLFNGANNQASPANVTGFAFANATVRGFNALVTVSVDATTDLFETFNITGSQGASGWTIAVDSTGDDSQVLFSITSAGQIQYTGGNYSGFSSMRIYFRASALEL